MREMCGRSLGKSSGAVASKRGTAGFNRVELVVVIGVLVLLAELLLPRLARANATSKSARCLHNLNVLTRAWSLYATDNSDRLVMNYHGGEAQMGTVARDPKAAPWALGWQDWSSAPDNTNYLFLTEPKYSRLAVYLRGDPKPFKCPADTYISGTQRARGWKERVRSVSASVGIGEGNAQSGPFERIYKQVRVTGDFLFPSPAETWVYLDEHPDSMNEPAFFSPAQNHWVDTPATYHNGASHFAFADGHTEGRRWVASLASAAVRKVRIAPSLPPTPRPGDRDLAWLSYHTARTSERSY